MVNINIDVDGIERTFRDFERDLKRGMEDAAEEIADTGQEHAQQILAQNPRPHIFTGELIRSFRYIEGRSTSYGVDAKLVNYADHAEAQEYGVPASEYADGGPPVQALLPWVEAKLGGMDLSYEGGDDGGGSGTHEMSITGYRDDFTVQIPYSFKTFDEDEGPDPKEMFIGQSVIVADKVQGTKFNARVVQAGGKYVYLVYEGPDNDQHSINLKTSGGDTVIIAAENWDNRSFDEKLRDIKVHINQVPTPFDDSRTQMWSEDLIDDYYTQFKDIKEAKRYASGLTKITKHSGSGDASA